MPSKTAPAETSPAPVRDRGPAGWLIPFIEARYTRMAEREEVEPPEALVADGEKDEREAAALEDLARLAAGEAPADTGQEQSLGVRSRLQPGRGEEVFAPVELDYWYGVVEQYRQRQRAARRSPARLAGRATFDRAEPPMPGIPGTSNWVPVGPSVVRRGQPTGRPAISGRASGIAIAPGGSRVYVATPDGGVWRSDDGGATWASTMENFDVDPTTFATISLSCGAIAIDEAQPDRVYVGTGEGDTDALFSNRVTNALPSYRGVGPLRSDDGGGSWVNETTDAGSPTLVGAAFFQLAVDPGDRERVVAATNIGLYRREPDGAGGHHWVRKRSGRHSSVVVARSGGTTTFFAAAWGDQVYSSTDGSTWSAVGTGFPSSINRIGLAVRRASASVVYALVANTSNGLQGVYRLDGGAGPWKAVSGAPSALLGAAGFEQGDYDLTIAVDPNNANRIFMGGSAVNVSDGAIYRGVVTTSGSAYSMTATFVGTGSHPDVHAVVYAPGDSGTVWSCCDGGVFRTAAATGVATFEARNTGLATMSANFLALHPSEAAVMFCGFQDNGTGKFTGEECWTHVWGGDGGYPVINWADPRRVLVYANGRVQRATDGGRDYTSFTNVTPTGAQWFVMAQPLVEAPPSSTTSDAEIVAYGAGTSIFLTTDFGSSWATLTAVGGGSAFCITFASASRFYVGTTGGRVYRYDRSGTTWTQTRIDNASGGALPLTALVTDIAIDPADSTGASIFLALGGSGDYRHVWRFNGTSWSQRSGPSAGAMTSLLDVEHNALAVDGSTLYTGADIGVWRSTNGGSTWAPMETGLPDSAVLDLKLHQPSRRLRAALHGRGVYEFKLDTPTPANVELYMRDTTLDLGYSATADGRDDPATWPADVTRHWVSPNIKVDVPTPSGWQTTGTDLDFYMFADKLVDGSGGVATLDSASGTVTNRVYVEVHNRGISVAQTVQVMLVIADAWAGLPSLPAGYATSVQAGTPINNANWKTVGIVDVTNLRVGVPRIVEFDLPSTMLAPPASLPGHAHFCALALIHSTQDAFSSTQTNVDLLTVNDRKVAQKNLHLVQFVGAPPGTTRPGQWVRVMMGADGRRGSLNDLLVLDLRGVRGRLGLLAPEGVLDPDALGTLEPGDPELVKQWAAEQRGALERLLKESRFDREGIAQMFKDVERVEAQPLFLLAGGEAYTLRTGPLLDEGTAQPLFLRIEGAEKRVRKPQSYEFTVALHGKGRKLPPGGSTYHVEILPPAPRDREGSDDKGGSK